MMDFLPVIGYNGVSNKANGAGVQPPRAALTLTGGVPMSARTNVTYSTPVSIPHSEKYEQLALRFDEESPYDPANAIPDFDHARNTWHHLTPKRIEQFWASVDKSGGADACWNWKQATTYGEYYLGTHKERTHRLAYNLSSGEDIPPGMEVCHTCDNPACCNPAHLFIGTHRDNMIDLAQKGRTGRTNGRKPGLASEPKTTKRKSGIRNGSRNGQSKLTEDDVRAIRAVYATGEISQRRLAKQYGVHPSLIGFIVRREYWQHVE